MQQATSNKQQATSNKQQATSNKQQVDISLSARNSNRAKSFKFKTEQSILQIKKKVLFFVLFLSSFALNSEINYKIESFISAILSSDTPALEEISATSDSEFFKELTKDYALAETDFNYAFNKIKDGVVITGYTGSDRVVIIPATIENYPVVEISENAFSENDYILSVIIPYTIKNLPKFCFYGCDALHSVVIPGSIKRIPKECFRYSTRLEFVKLCEGIEIIGRDSFVGCHRFKKLILPNSVKVIEDNAFYSDSSNRGNPYFKEIHFGNSLEIIGKEAFCYSNVETLDFPASIKIIGDLAFYKSRNLKSVSFAPGAKNLKQIGNEAFAHCFKLENFDFVNSLEKIGNTAFVECVKLQELNFGESLNQIGEGSFRNCVGLTVISFSKNLKIIGAGAFDGCQYLREIKISEKIKRLNFSHKKEDRNYYPYDYGNEAFRACGKLKLAVRAKLEALGYKGSFSGSPNWEPFEK